jgi:isopentenyl-diphosphate delta-isomerase
VLVDDDDHIIGTAPKLDVNQSGALHRALSIVVWDSAKRLLLQKRQAGKYHSGRLWTKACCGHPRPGEDVADGARRRLGEEMGFTCPLTNLGTIRYHATLDRALTEHEIVHVFLWRHRGTEPGRSRQLSIGADRGR